MSIKTTIARGTGTLIFKTKQYSPEILTGLGIVGLAASGVLAARQTLKLGPITDQMQHEIGGVKSIDHVTEKAEQKALMAVYISGALEICKVYVGPVTLALLSTAAILGGQTMLRKRNVALVAAYKAIETAYSKYRERVVEEIGEEKERELRMNLRAFTETDAEGVTVTKERFVGDEYSPYAKIFGRDNVDWNENQDINVMRLLQQERYWNDLLKLRGFVTLNEVYKELGFKQTEAGAVVGWMYGKDGVDNFIDFGIFDQGNIRNGAYVDGTEGHIFLDFNVDGPIYTKLGENDLR